MTVTRTRRRRWLVAGIALAAAASALGIAWATVPGFPLGMLDRADSSSGSGTYAFDISDPAQQVGDADDVFLARVIEQSGAGFFWDSDPDSSDDEPYTLYRVKVLENLKGKLSGVIEVSQAGGARRDGSTQIFENDPLLKAGETCLLITVGEYNPSITEGEYDPSAGPDQIVFLYNRPAIQNPYGHIRVRSEAEQTKVLDKYRAAVADQVEPEL